MVVEVALALVLLVGAGLMVRTLRQLTLVDPGFRPSHLLTMRFALTGDRWDKPRLVAFYDDLLGRVRALPGVAGAALTDSLPIDGSNWNSIFIAADKPVPPRPELPGAAFTPVSSGYFETLGMTLERGRLFGTSERPNSAPAVVVNHALAQRMWPGEDPIGKTFKLYNSETLVTVVGVVRNVRDVDLKAGPAPFAFFPLRQQFTAANVSLMATTPYLAAL